MAQQAQESRQDRKTKRTGLVSRFFLIFLRSPRRKVELKSAALVIWRLVQGREGSNKVISDLHFTSAMIATMAHLGGSRLDAPYAPRIFT